MFVAFLVAIAPAPAQAAMSQAPVNAAQHDSPAMVEALGMLDDEGFEEETLRTAEMTMELVLGTMLEKIQSMSTEEIPEEFIKELRETMRDHQQQTLRANMPSIKRQAAAIYAKEFSREELARLRELGRDPVMAKARARGKVINPQLMLIGVREMKAAEPELEAKVQGLVSKHMAKKSKGSDQS